jgi:hypothetical protein
MNANLIQEPPRPALRAGLPAYTVALMAGRHACQVNNMERKKIKDRNVVSLSGLCHLCKVASHRLFDGIS